MPIMARATVDLPQPDSPTSPKISPFRKSKEIPLTACTVRDLLMGKCCL